MSAPNGIANSDKAARRQRFEDVFPVIAEELLGYVRGEGMPQDAVEWFEKVRYYINTTWIDLKRLAELLSIMVSLSGT
jgi:farnesyl diphosphate synthase